MDRFEHFLKNQCHINSKQISYYMKWVTDCMRSIDILFGESVPLKDKQEFIHGLSTKREDWQVKQADHALVCTVISFKRFPMIQQETMRKKKRCGKRLLWIHGKFFV